MPSNTVESMDDIPVYVLRILDPKDRLVNWIKHCINNEKYKQD